MNARGDILVLLLGMCFVRVVAGQCEAGKLHIFRTPDNATALFVDARRRCGRP